LVRENKRCFQLAEIDDMDHMTPRSHLNYFSENNSVALPCNAVT
jgi:CBS domain containing-hemolysin-like protein